MSKVMIAYGSTTGNTAEVAEWIGKNLQDRGFQVTAEDCAGLEFESVFSTYDLVVLGCSTYGDDPIEIQEDFEPLLESLESAAISGKKVAIFGCGDRSYRHFCGAVDEIEKRVVECGGVMLVDPLRVDTPHDGFRNEIDAWVEGVAAAA